ncbi:GNAT family N-acetyltransferase [Oscillospiraceae bacterium CM]|nr:GNAT family N-acetyltransferase [Oscillospiraceae bacterium CM]
MEHLPDIYFTPEYGRLYETHEGGVFESFEHQTPDGTVYFQFLRRPLTGFQGFERYGDITTPYGYGGPVILGTVSDKKRLAQSFAAAFREYCLDHQIVASFIRFHPVVNNAADFTQAFDTVIPLRKTVAIDLTKDIFNEEFEQTVRNSYRHAAERGLSIQFDSALETMGDFTRLYYDLMASKQTSAYYFFPPSYFEALKGLHGRVELVNALIDGEIVASVLYLKYHPYIHTHLTTTTSAGNKTRAIGFIKSARALRAKEEGYLLNHLGGGFSNSPDDSLFHFKSRFSNSPPYDFCVGKSIYDQKTYDALVAAAARHGEAADAGYFPLYRAPRLKGSS